jgi:flagellar M-ring protein FliF
MINISAVEFLDGLEGEEIAQPGIMDRMIEQAGTMINAGAFIAVVFLVVWFGLKPMAAALNKPSSREPSFDEVRRSLPGPEGSVVAGESAMSGMTSLPGSPSSNPLEDLRQRLRPAPQDRLARMVDLNEERTAQILRKWARQEAA